MNRRIAKKILRGPSHRYFEEALYGWCGHYENKRKIARIKNRHPSSVFSMSMKMSMMSKKDMIEYWQVLKPKIEKELSKRNEQKETWNEPIQDVDAYEKLKLDLEYYSDRWCWWRVDKINKIILELA